MSPVSQYSESAFGHVVACVQKSDVNVLPAVTVALKGDTLSEMQHGCVRGSPALWILSSIVAEKG